MISVTFDPKDVAGVSIPVIMAIRTATGETLERSKALMKQGRVLFIEPEDAGKFTHKLMTLCIPYDVKTVKVAQGLSDFCSFSLEEIPNLPQRQDSVTDQLNDLLLVGVKLGMYDAVDLIRRNVK